VKKVFGGGVEASVMTMLVRHGAQGQYKETKKDVET
jgi:hypothetical protein